MSAAAAASTPAAVGRPTPLGAASATRVAVAVAVVEPMLPSPGEVFPPWQTGRAVSDAVLRLPLARDIA